jgi:hypothetical protein
VDPVSAARQAVALRAQLDDALARQSHDRSEQARAKPGSKFHEQMRNKLAKTSRTVEALQNQLAPLLTATTPEHLAAARARQAQRKKRPPRGAGKPTIARPSGQPAVTIRRTTPSAVSGPTCKKCGTWAPLHTTQGWCGKCLRATGREPCPRCGTWLEAKQVKKHSCGLEPSRSVPASSAGAPGLGRRR